ncbi:unnamed protein product, partial [Symbiodinium sp. KB8]
NILCLLLALMSEITLIVLLSLYDERVFVAKIGIVIGIPVAQVLPLIFGLAGFIVLKRTQKRLKEQLRLISKTTQKMKNEHALMAVSKVQSVLRGNLARREYQRRQELEAWLSSKTERSFLTTVIYIGVAIYILFAYYICLLFGVKFTPEQAEGWVVASLISFALDMFFQAPLITLIKAIIGLLLLVARSSTRNLLLGKLKYGTTMDKSQRNELLEANIKGVLVDRLK